MNPVNPYLKQYKKNQVETATPEKLLILLYDGAIQYLNKAKIAFVDNETEQIHINLLGCENIILEFMNTLNMEEGGTLATNLYRLYDYLYNTLVTANLQKDVRKVDEVLGHLVSLRETWQKAIDISTAERIAESKAREDNDDDDDDEKEGRDWA